VQRLVDGLVNNPKSGLIIQEKAREIIAILRCIVLLVMYSSILALFVYVLGSKDVYEVKTFKKTFNRYADNIYYSDPPRRANLYLGGGTTPTR